MARRFKSDRLLTFLDEGYDEGKARRKPVKNHWIRFCLPASLLLSVLAYTLPAIAESGAEAFPLHEKGRLASVTSSGQPSLAKSMPTLSEQWLSIQAGGQAASPHAQEATEAERELSLRRLLESYHHPIPMLFEQDTGGDFAR